LLKSVYSMTQYSRKTHLLYGLAKVNILWGKSEIDREKKNERERRKSETLSLARKGLWHWS